MELIKKIKQAESQAREVIERATVQAGEESEKSKETRRIALEEAGGARKKAIEASVSDATSQGAAEAEQLRNQAEKDRQGLGDKAKGRITAAAAKVMDYLGSDSMTKQQAEPLEG